MTIPTNAPEPITCPACGNLITEQVTIKGITFVHAGGGVWRELRGWCAQCGTPFYWTTSDNQIQTLMAEELAKGKHG